MSTLSLSADGDTAHSFAPCSPCSSCATYVDDMHVCPLEPHPLAAAELTIMLPNQIDQISVRVADVESFIHSLTNNHIEICVLHLLIYLFETASPPYAPHINQLKLLHCGKLYNISRPLDLSCRQSLLQEVLPRSSIFQFMVSPHSTSPPLDMNVQTMLSLISSRPSQDDDAPPVTYAEAMARLIKKSAKRASRSQSVGSAEQRSPATRYASRGSATDVEDSYEQRPKHSIKHSLKKMLRNPLSTHTKRRWSRSSMLCPTSILAP